MRLLVIGNDETLDKCLVFLDDTDDEDQAITIARNARLIGDVECVVPLTPQQESVLEDVIYKRQPYQG